LPAPSSASWIRSSRARSLVSRAAVNQRPRVFVTVRGDFSDPGASAGRRTHPSHRPRRPVRLEAVSRRAEALRDAAEHECDPELLRQRLHGIVLRHSESRTGTGGVRQRPVSLPDRSGPFRPSTMSSSSRSRGSIQTAVSVAGSVARVLAERHDDLQVRPRRAAGCRTAAQA
jgi:hypothetical protein